MQREKDANGPQTLNSISKLVEIEELEPIVAPGLILSE